nr:GFA family protein [Rhizobium sp. Q54]
MDRVPAGRLSLFPHRRTRLLPGLRQPPVSRYDDDGRIRLTGGSLDHPELIRPQYHYGVESRLPWMDCGQGLREEETRERF